MWASVISNFTNFIFQLNTSSGCLSILQIVCLHKHILLSKPSPFLAIGCLHIQHIVLNLISLILISFRIFYLFDLKNLGVKNLRGVTWRRNNRVLYEDSEAVTGAPDGIFRHEKIQNIDYVLKKKFNRIICQIYSKKRNDKAVF